MGAIGLTGGIACGKSEVAGILRSEKIPVLDTDAVAHALLSPGQWVFEKVVREFGREYLNEEGGINRRKLGRFVFEHDDARTLLNNIMHPVILAEMETWLNAELSRHAYAVAMVPLLFETGSDVMMEKILVVAADEERVLERLRHRGWTSDEIAMRIRAQMPLANKVAKADGVIWNNEDLTALRERALTVWKEIVLERK